MANWLDSANKYLEKKEKNKPKSYVSVPETNSTTTGTTNPGSWKDSARQSLTNRNYVAPDPYVYVPAKKESKNDVSTVGMTDEGKEANTKLATDDSVPLAIEIDGEVKNFGNISINAYEAISNNKLDSYKPKNEDEKKAITEYTKFAEEYAKKQREPENFGQGLLHGVGYTAEKLGAGAVSGIYDLGRFARAGVSKLLSIPAWGSWEDALNKDAEAALYHKGPGEAWDESIEERYRVPDWYRENVGTAVSNIGQLAVPVVAEIATAPVGGASPLLEIKLAQKATMGALSKKTIGSVAKTISTRLVKPKASDIVFGLSAAGSSAKAGYRQSGDVGKALNYGVLNGLGEVATEKLFGGIGGTGIGADELFDVGKALSKIKGVSKLASNKYGKKVLDLAFEGVEEEIMALADPLMQKATIKSDASLADVLEMYKNTDYAGTFFQGMLLSGLMNAGTFTVNKTTNAVNKMKAIKTINNATNGINALFENDKDKLVPLNFKSTIEEIKQRQNEIGVFTMGYADIMIDELVKNNPEKFASVEKISVGDKFKDTKTGYTITIVNRDTKKTTVEIDTGANTITKQFDNVKADTFITSDQLVEVENTPADTTTVTTANKVADDYEGEADVSTQTEAVAPATPKTINLKRVGNSYEVYGDEAVALAKELDTNTKRTVVNGVEQDVMRVPADLMLQAAERMNEEFTFRFSDKPVASEQKAVTPQAEMPGVKVGDVYVADGKTYTIISRENGRTTYTVTDENGNTVTRTTSNVTADINFTKEDAFTKVQDGTALNNEAVAEENTADNEDTTSAEENATEGEISVVTDAIYNTAKPEVKSDLENGNLKDNLESIAKTLMYVYNEQGTLNGFESFFTDGGKKVIDAIESINETRNNVNDSKTGSKVLKNQAKSDTMKPTTEKSSAESEENSNEQTGSNSLYENGKRTNNESAGKKTERLLSFRRKNQGKNAADRQSFARELIERGQVEEVNQKHGIYDFTYTLVKPEAYSDDMLAMVEEGKKNGKEVVFFVGEAKCDIEIDETTTVTKEFDGIAIGSGKILIRYDGVDSPQTLYKHEYCHSIWNTPAMQKIKNKIISSLSPETKQKILSEERYADYLEAYNNKKDEVWQEFVCDVMSGMNDYTANYIDVVENFWNANERAERYNPSTYAESTDAGGDVRLSLNWRTDLNRTQYKQVEKWIRQAGNPEITRITDTANWYKGRINGDDLFVIYSDKSTILYEVKGKDAKVELDILMDILEDEEYGESINGKSSFTQRVSKGNWVQNVNNSQNNLGNLGSGQNNRNVGVLQRQSQRNGSPAFWSVLENLFKIQERGQNSTEEGLNDGIKLSLSKGSYAPTFYSHMGKTIEEMKQDKIGANSVISYLKGRGVKDEEIKWSGIEEWLSGKKSVTKAELQEFAKNSMLQIEVETLEDDITIRYTQDELDELDRDRKLLDKAWEKANAIWNEAYGTDIPADILGNDDAISAMIRYVIDQHGGIRDFEGISHLNDAERKIYNDYSADSITRKIKDLEEHQAFIAERAKARRDNSKKTKHHKYTLDGGSGNYRELLFKIPESDYTNSAMSLHWDGRTGVVAHARVQDFVDTDGNKVLFIEEIQSDWHNEGAKKGYRNKNSQNASKLELGKFNDGGIEPIAEVYDENGNLYAYIRKASSSRFAVDYANGTYFGSYDNLVDAMNDLNQDAQGENPAVPDAPFRSTYHEFVLKNLLRMAAEQGYDSIGWTTGQTQEDRWSSDYAEAYRIEYDQEIPKFLNKYGKKWGAKVGKTEIGKVDGGWYEVEGTTIWTMPITDEMKNSVLYEGQPRFSLSKNVEETKEYVAVHNLSPEKLLKTLKLGGLPMPSIAIIRASEGWNNFGAISVVFNKETIDPQFFRNNKVYSGDAWTPTYPQIAYKVNEKAQEKIKKKIDNLVPKNIQNDLGGLHLDSSNMEDKLNRNGDMVQSYLYSYAMKYAFLKDNNVDIEFATKDEPLYRYGEVSNSAVISFAHSMVEGLKTVNSLLEQHSSKLMADTELLTGIANVLNEEVMSTVDKSTDAYQKLVENPLYKAEDIDLSTVLGMLEAARKYFGLNGKTESRIDYKNAREKIDDYFNSHSLEKEYEYWLKNLFSDVIAKEGIRNNKDLFTPSGNRRSFEALHYEHTLENVIKAMKEQGDKGIGGFGGGNIFGAATTEYGSIDDVKADAQNRMQQLPESKYDEIKKGFSDRLYELANSLPIHKDSFSAVDDAANMLIEAVSKFKTKGAMANYLRKESQGWAKYNDNIADELIELVNDIRNMPVSYFEAKPQRAVGFDEIKAVIMPEQSSYEDDLTEIKDKLDEYGIPVIEYEYGDNNDRLKALNSLEEVRFSFANGKPRITADMTDGERTKILSSKSFIAPVYEGQADEVVRSNLADLNSGKIGLVKNAIVAISEQFGIIGSDIQIDDVDVQITLSKSNLKESVSKKLTPAEIAKLIPVLKESVSNAIGIERHDNRYYYDTSTVYFENLLGGFVDGEYFVPVRFGLKHSKSGQATLYVVVDQNKIPIKSLDKIKKTKVVKTPAPLHKEVATSASRLVEYRISQIIPFVKSKDLLRYIPDNMLDTEQKNAKWEAIADTIKTTAEKNDKRYKKYISEGKIYEAQKMVEAAAKVHGYTIKAYHGTSSEFTVFDKSRQGKANGAVLGNAFYFSSDKDIADEWGGRNNTMSVFLRLQNPIKVDSTITDDMLRAYEALPGKDINELEEFYNSYMKKSYPTFEDYLKVYEENKKRIIEIDTKDTGSWINAINTKGDSDNASTDLLKEFGVDGIISEHKRSRHFPDWTEYAVFDENQIKSADTITYDDNGDIIPLSERFNPENADIRWSFAKNNSPDSLETQKRIESIAEDIGSHNELIEYAKKNTQEFVSKMKENNSLQKRLHNAKRQMLLSPAPNVNIAKVGKITNEILKEMDSTLKATDLRERVTSIYNEYFAEIKKGKGVASKTQAANDNMMNKFAELAVEIANSSEAFVETEGYTLLKSYLKHTRIRIPDDAKSELHFGEFRKANMGSLNLTNDGLDIDVAYMELCEMFPHLFDAEITAPADQAFAIAETLEKSKPYAYNPHDDFMPEAVEHIVYRFASETDGLAAMPKTKAQKIAEKSAYDKEVAVEKERATFERKLEKQKAQSEDTIRKLQKKIDDGDYVRYWEKRLDKEEKRRAINELREKRDVAILKSKIRNIVSDMKKNIDKTEKAGGYPKELVKAAADVCSALDFHTGRTQKDGTPTKVSLKLDALKLQYDALKDNPNYDFQSEHSEMLSEMIKKLQMKVEGKRVVDLGVSELSELKEILSEIRHRLSYAKKQISLENARENAAIGADIINSLNTKSDVLSDIQNSLLRRAKLARQKGKAFVLNPHRINRMIALYDENSAWWKLYDAINRGSRKAAKFTMEANKPFDELIDGGANEIAFYDFRTKKVKTGIKYMDGTEVEIPKSIVCELVMAWNRKQGRTHLESNGAKIPDMELYNRGETRVAVTDGGRITKPITQSDIDRLKSLLDSYDLEWMSQADNLFNKVGKDAINETSMELLGRELAKTENYIRLYVDEDFVAREIDGEKANATLESHGSLKETKPGAKQTIVLRGLHENIYDHIDFVSKYYGLAIPIRNFNKIYNMSLSVDGNTFSVKGIIGKKFGSNIRNNVVEQLIRDLQAPRPKSVEPFGKIRGKWLNATFWGNVRSMLKQTTSYWTASAKLGEDSLVKGLKQYRKHSKQTRAEIAKYSGTLYKRAQGLSTTELGDRANSNRLAGASNKMTKFINKHAPVLRKIPKGIRPGNWLQSMDCAVSAALWEACKVEVSKTMDMSAEGYMKAVADLYESVIEETQSNYDVAHRPEALKNTNAIVRTITMFQTDNLQQTGIIYDALADYQTKSKAFEKDNSAANQKAVDVAKKRLAKAIRSRIYSSLWLAFVTMLGDMILRKFKPYMDDEEKDITSQSVLERLMMNMCEDMFGVFVPVGGSLITNALDTFVHGYDFLTEPSFDVVHNFIESTSEIWEAVSDEDGSWEDIQKALVDAIPAMSNITGVPLKNIYDLFNAVKGYAGDIKAGDFIHDITDYGISRSFYTHGDLAAYIVSGDKDKETKLLEYYSVNGKEVNKGALTKEIKPAYVQMWIDSRKNADAIKRKLILDYDYTEDAIDAWVIDEYLNNIVSHPEYATEIKNANTGWNFNSVKTPIKKHYKDVYKNGEKEELEALKKALSKDMGIGNSVMQSWEAEADKEVKKKQDEAEKEKAKFR